VQMRCPVGPSRGQNAIRYPLSAHRREPVSQRSSSRSPGLTRPARCTTRVGRHSRCSGATQMPVLHAHFCVECASVASGPWTDGIWRPRWKRSPGSRPRVRGSEMRAGEAPLPDRTRRPYPPHELGLHSKAGAYPVRKTAHTPHRIRFAWAPGHRGGALQVQMRPPIVTRITWNRMEDLCANPKRSSGNNRLPRK